jgi:hypothetical protein
MERRESFRPILAPVYRPSYEKFIIDEYVVAESDTVRDQFLRYETLLLEEYPNTYLTTHEQMISDFGSGSLLKRDVRPGRI